jgi:hypothetical protein
MNGKRRIRIIGKPQNTNGNSVSVYDADTGDEIINVTNVELTLSATGQNLARVTYNVMHPDHTLLINRSHEPVVRKVDVEVTEVDVTAWNEGE